MLAGFDTAGGHLGDGHARERVLKISPDWP
jgi:hypothetical protein